MVLYTELFYAIIPACFHNLCCSVIPTLHTFLMFFTLVLFSLQPTLFNDSLVTPVYSKCNGHVPNSNVCMLLSCSNIIMHVAGYIRKCTYLLQVAELASLAQLLPPCSPTVRNPAPDSSLKSCFSPIASASAAARRLHPLQLLLPGPIAASASTAACALRLPPPRVQLLLPDCACFSCCSPPNRVHFDCCSPIVSA